MIWSKAIRQFFIGALTSLFCISSSTVRTQTISGSFEFEPSTSLPEQVVLWNTFGGEHTRIDSALVRKNATFSFEDRAYATGFYQLTVNDTDLVDIILDPHETELNLRFSGRPLQEHVQIIASLENQRLWEYKAISRDSQERARDNLKARSGSSYHDTVARQRFDSIDASIIAAKQSNLDRLIEQDPSSYFTKMVVADRQLMSSIPMGFEAIRDAFDWSDGELLRSAIHDKAVMAVLQSIPMDMENGLVRVCDSVLFWSEPDLECWSRTRALLIELFDQYGPDHVTQHLVDSYVVGEKVLVPPDNDLLRIVAELLRVTVGAKAPDGKLPDPLTKDTTDIATLLSTAKYTALFFYSSTCDHCHDQMPGLRQLYADEHGKGFEIIGIALDADTMEF
ncbi:MAG TPA: redoxin domain-containing protein, partial [Flavobacteriales bacterium]|nr:redoxin domain-containing protein [Flavobacteriales bacterium]